MLCLPLLVAIFVFTTATKAEKCTTPNNEVAECISLYSCPALTTALATHDNASIELVRKSNCGGTALEPMLCCGSLSNFSTPNVLAKSPNNDKNKLLPDRRYCGYQHSDDYVPTTDGIGISEFPWLAGLLYDRNETLCGGSLISNRYVLTAAHCVVIPPHRNLTAVRLGEYNLKNQTDCVGEDSDWSYECSGKPQDFGIAKSIVHPQYNKTYILNDVALLRLDRTVVYSEKCTTPNNEVAECISLYSCPALIKALATHDNASIELVRKSNCAGTALEPMVCCGSLSNFNTPNVSTSPNHDKNKLLPDRRYCGYQHSDDYVSTTNGIGISEFPWVAGLLYNYRNETLCGGSLISNRYVLTAAHCVLTRSNNLIAVRLGEYNLKNQTDCVGEHSDWSYECNGKPQDFGIAKRVVHPQYSRRPKAKNDIALLRLDKTVVYSDYTRPICLPTPEIKSAEIGEILTISGWGRRSLLGEQVETKKRILMKLISNDECLAIKQYEGSVTENNFCIKELDSGTEYACQDRLSSGGPAMISRRNQWHQEGILSFGKGCHEGFPDVYTKVARYMDWIKETIEP